MIICVLVFYPASRLDWLVLARLTGATIANMPGDPSGVPGTALKSFDAAPGAWPGTRGTARRRGLLSWPSRCPAGGACSPPTRSAERLAAE